MHKIILLFTSLIALPASASEPVRCGTDDFGNTVCMDKDGVLTTSPGQTAVPGKDKAKAPGTPDGNGDKSAKPRCAIDQFGNTVCGESFKKSFKE